MRMPPTDSEPSESTLPPPEPADIGIVAALSIEVGPLRDLLKSVREYNDPHGRRRPVIEGELGSKLVALIIGGAGVESARKATLRLLAGHRPRWLVSAGFGGALDPDLKRNDVVLATEVLHADAQDQSPLAIDLRLPEESTSKGRIRSGRLLTVSKIIRTSAEKATLRDRFRAVAVDMETAGVASVCAERGVRFLAVRVISDEANTDLPPEVLSVLGPSGSFRLGATLGALWHRPSSIKDLWTLREHAIEAADRLAEVLPGLLDQLP